MSRQRAEESFRHVYGQPSDGQWSAPGRVNLIGEHTDYNEGFVLPFAIPQRTTVSVGRRIDTTIRVHSADLGETVEMSLSDLAPEVLSGWSGYPLGVAWALLDGHADLDSCQGVDIALASEVPLGAGLSSSAALDSSVALALNELWGIGLDRAELALVGQRAENTAVGAQTGIMDQMASVMGADGHAVFLDCRSLQHELIPCDLGPAGYAFVVIDTNTRHSHAGGEYGQRRASCERAAATVGVGALRDLSVADLPSLESQLDDETFRRARHIVSENDRVLATIDALREGDLAQVGALLVASHESMRDDFEISTAELDAQVESAREMGALGARMTGGGFGGSVIAIVATDRVEALTSAAQERAAREGMPAPTVSVVEPSDGAQSHWAQ